MNTCAACGAPNPPVRCAGCHRVAYCDAACQRGDWKRHKRFCGCEACGSRDVAATGPLVPCPCGGAVCAACLPHVRCTPRPTPAPDDICSICHDRPPDDGAVSPPCGHVFCVGCLESWKRTEAANGRGDVACPVCRRMVWTDNAMKFSEAEVVVAVAAVTAQQDAAMTRSFQTIEQAVRQSRPNTPDVMMYTMAVSAFVIDTSTAIFDAPEAYEAALRAADCLAACPPAVARLLRRADEANVYRRWISPHTAVDAAARIGGAAGAHRAWYTFLMKTEGRAHACGRS